VGSYSRCLSSRDLYSRVVGFLALLASLPLHRLVSSSRPSPAASVATRGTNRTSEGWWPRNIHDLVLREAFLALTALALNCTLKSGDEPSSTQKLLDEVLAALNHHKVAGECVRIADLNIKPGVTSDEGEGDEWPALRKRILKADILVLGTPIWLGQPSSIAKRVLERMDAFLEETDDHNRMPSYGKVAVVAIVGNEDGAHHCHAEMFQALNDVGFTIPAGAGTYWVGEAMGSTDYKDLRKPYDKTVQATKMLASNAAHLASLLKQKNYSGT
jgi:multimeric flavodoxin WrbA